ncbi:hypothetical protein [Polynucleobacter brandtiae]|uniref:Uncharacterized protein n=1 Tax=Polynucleobacter brandtiae TaxID=1938816 RepID=A0A2M8VZT1_9BURK|nr:hypothetical protein [Polynucleobacter brandtiae]PJI83377.1 hypothetical protein B0G85_0775 [Polynucleobacter brandtiae]
MINKDTEYFSQKIQNMLEDESLEVHLMPPSQAFTIIYSTTPASDLANKSTAFHRTKTTINGDAVLETIITNEKQLTENIGFAIYLVKFADYQVTSIFKGWSLTCKKCHSIIKGAIWQESPDTCVTTVDSVVCGHLFTNAEKLKVSVELNN